MPEILRFLEGWINYGERYEKMPARDPLSRAARVDGCCWSSVSRRPRGRIWRGEVDRLVASHEVEEEIDEVRARTGGHD